LIDLSAISRGTLDLSPKDKVKLITHEGCESVDTKFQLAFEAIEDLLTTRTERNRTTLTLLIKKPDLLGASMWEVLRHGDKARPAKIEDERWLERFRNREIDLRPGDAILAKVEVVTRFGENDAILDVKYNVFHVEAVIQADGALQAPLIGEQ
jgi:hypothetical protein